MTQPTPGAGPAAGGWQPPFSPLSPTPVPPPPPAPQPSIADADPGFLVNLEGSWRGTGFNAIWRPSSQGQDRFLELNRTQEALTVTRIPGGVPNRGLLQGDLVMAAFRYTQTVADANQGGAALHIEPGLWLNVPATQNPLVPASVARLGCIPHGTTIVAQGLASDILTAPQIDPVSLNPSPVGNPGGASRFPEQDLTAPTAFRTEPEFLTGITQALVDDPNSLIRAEVSSPNAVTQTVVFNVTTTSQPMAGGGTAETAFLAGGSSGPNAHVAEVSATFLVVTRGDGVHLLYTQRVLLNFNGLSWPHVSVGVLSRT